MPYFDITPLSWQGILVALFCGGIVGAERQFWGKPAGIRTCTLVCLGTYTFIILGSFAENGVADSTRVLGQVITGIGFLGAGVILSRDGILHGVTSAATIWMLAAIGCMIGFGNFHTAILLAVMTVIILVGIDFIEKKFSFFRKGVHETKDTDPKISD